MSFFEDVVYWLVIGIIAAVVILVIMTLVLNAIYPPKETEENQESRSQARHRMRIIYLIIVGVMFMFLLGGTYSTLSNYAEQQ